MRVAILVVGSDVPDANRRYYLCGSVGSNQLSLRRKSPTRCHLTLIRAEDRLTAARVSRYGEIPGAGHVGAQQSEGGKCERGEESFHTGEDSRSSLLVVFVDDFPYPQSMERITHDEIVRLSPPERLTLISQLWDSLDQDQLPLTEAQMNELDRRLSSIDRDRKEGVTWEALKADLEQRSR